MMWRGAKTNGALIEITVDTKISEMMAAEASFKISRVIVRYFSFSSFDEEFSSSCSFNHPKLSFFFIVDF